MSTTIRIDNPTEFWAKVVVPDYNDYMAEIGELRLAFHCAISLFHMADWIYVTHKAAIDKSFTFVDQKTNVTKQVSKASEFANALGELHPNFALIRQIANTAKHLKLSSTSTHPNAPTHAANTASSSSGYGQRGFGQVPYGGVARVMLANHPGRPDLEFTDIAKSTFEFWENLKISKGW